MTSTTDNGPSKGPSAVITVSIFTAIALIIVVLRLVTRIVFVRNIGLDDWLVTAALVCIALYKVCAVLKPPRIN